MQINPRQILQLKVGGKAYQLVRLKRLYNVPPFFIIVFESANEISEIANQDIIIQECQKRRFELVAVRSSGSCEDSVDASFAGMFKTVLNVRPHEIIGATQEVLGSVNTKRVSDYCKAHRFDKSKIRMSVIIQKMVQSRVSGVCFTRLQGEPDMLVIEACYGLGQALVSGKVTPDAYKVNRNTLQIVEEHVGYQSYELQASKRDDTRLNYVEIPFYLRNAKKLTSDEIKDIAKTCVSIERHLGLNAVDVEWSYEADTLYILQARPYTGFTL
jgi:pyruvate,water dikinase